MQVKCSKAFFFFFLIRMAAHLTRKGMKGSAANLSVSLLMSQDPECGILGVVLNGA